MNPFEMMKMLNNFRSNPAAFLLQYNLNVPQNIVASNNPNQILQYLLSTNQISQDQLNNAYQQAMMYKQ